MTTWTGTAPTFTAGDTTTVTTNLNTLRDAVKAASEAWTAFTPTWTASTNPALGNGSFDGSKYLRINKLIIGRIVLTMGTTTTYGTGAWVMTLPVAAAADIGRESIHGTYRDNSAASDYPAAGIMTPSSSSIGLRHFPTTAGNPYTATTGTAPFTWATGDIVTFDFVYEAA